MKYYFLRILSITIVSGAFTFLLSGKKCENLFRYLASLCLLLALFSPIRLFFDGDFQLQLPDASQETGDYSEYISGVEEAASARLTENYRLYIEKETGLNENDFSVFIEVKCTDKAFSVTLVEVELYSLSGVFQRNKIDQCLEELKQEVRYIEKLS